MLYLCVSVARPFFLVPNLLVAAMQANHCNEFTMPKCPVTITNDQLPKQPLLN